jgi:hypothetical protein
MALPFSRGCPSSSYDSHCFATLGKADNEQSISLGIPHDEFAVFELRMIEVIKDCSQYIGEDGGSFLKRNAMLLEIGLGLPSVPFEPHRIVPSLPKAVRTSLPERPQGNRG